MRFFDEAPRPVAPAPDAPGIWNNFVLHANAFISLGVDLSSHLQVGYSNDAKTFRGETLVMCRQDSSALPVSGCLAGRFGVSNEENPHNYIAASLRHELHVRSERVQLGTRKHRR